MQYDSELKVRKFKKTAMPLKNLSGRQWPSPISVLHEIND